MAQSKEFVDASHALNDLSHALALLESENASLRGAVDGLCNENAKLRKYVAWLEKWALDHASFGLSADVQFELDMKRRELGVDA